MLPLDWILGKEQVDELEKLRSKYDIPHDALVARIACSPAITRKIQRQSYDILKTQYPESSEKFLLEMALWLRISTPPGYEISDQEVGQALENINSFDDLCDYIIELDDQEPAFPDPFGIGKRIDEILANES